MNVRVPLAGRLGAGLSALVSPEDAARVRSRRWRLQRDGYAYASVGGRRVSLHRFILGAPRGTQVDHRDGDRLNCTRENLRLASGAQNSRNRRPLPGSTSRFKGVTLHRQTGRWQAQVKCGKKNHYLGLFDTEEAAARAYNERAAVLHGTFAVLNPLPA